MGSANTAGTGVAPVLHVITDTNRRGAQVFATDLADELRECGLPGDVVAIRPGTRGAQLTVPTLGRGPWHLRTLRALRRRISAAEVVVAHGSNTLSACLLSSLGLRTPLVYRNISDPAYWMATPARRARVRAMLSRVDHVVALWEGGAQFLQDSLRVVRAKITVVPNAVRAADFRPATAEERTLSRSRFGLPQGAPVLLFAAALQPEKHPETAVRALEELPSDMHLLVVGEGPCHEEIVRLANQVAPGRVRFAGQIDDMVQAYWASDVIVLPSEGEGLPAVLIEGGLCRLPAVASTSGGNADIVVDGVGGELVPPADHLRLAAAVRDVLPTRELLGKAAAVHCAETFDLRAVAEQWATVLTGLSPQLQRTSHR
jgi:glycosyltransferase involved in cell wall biosynthesis